MSRFIQRSIMTMLAASLISTTAKSAALVRAK